MIVELGCRGSICSAGLLSLSVKIPQRYTPLLALSKAACLQIDKNTIKTPTTFNREYSSSAKAVLITPHQRSTLISSVYSIHHFEKAWHPSLGSVLVVCSRRSLSDSAASCQQRKAVVEKKTSSDGQQLTIGKKVAQASKDVSYAGIIIIGLGVLGLMFYTVGKELFSSHSPNGVYTNALKVCKHNVEIQDCLGTPIKGYGEMTRRKRRRHVSHLEYSQDGVNFMRMKFYLEGPHRKGTVHLEMKENERGQYEYRYLFVELDGHPSRTIILEDNR